MPPVSLPRGWIVGACSAVNGTFALRGFPQDDDARAAAGNEGWDVERAHEEDQDEQRHTDD